MEFWRSPAYQAFFDYLESKGGFYYEVIIVPHLPTSICFSNTTLLSDGETHPYTVSPPPYSQKPNKFIYSKISDTDTIPSNDARKENSIRRGSAGAIPGTALIMRRIHV